MQEHQVTVAQQRYPLPSPSSCWPPRTRSRWRAPIRCPRRSSTGSCFKVDGALPLGGGPDPIMERTTGAENRPRARPRPRSRRSSHAGAGPRRPDRQPRDGLRGARSCAPPTPTRRRAPELVRELRPLRRLAARRPRRSSSAARSTPCSTGGSTSPTTDIRARGARPPCGIGSSSTSRARPRDQHRGRGSRHPGESPPDGRVAPRGASDR